MERPIVALLTDFGAADHYAGVVRGVMLSINPRLTITDITHEVRPQAVVQGAFLLGASYRFFPPGTIHLVVVDPGVGTARRPLLLVGPEYAFVGPDNGLFSHVLANAYGGAEVRVSEEGLAPVPPGWTAHVLTQPAYWRQPVSTTFHGRDVFAPSAAHLSLGVAPEAMGEPTSTIAFNPPRRARWMDDALLGEVVHVDRYGNLITCIDAASLPQEAMEVEVGRRRILGLARSYQERDGLLAVVGSFGTLEVAVRNGSAARELGVDIGALVRVRRVV